MPARRESLALTDAYRARLVGLRDRVATLLLELWRSRVDYAELDGSFREWLAPATALVAGGQREAALLTGAYLGAYVSSELGEAVTPPELDLDRYAGRSAEGAPLASVLGTSLLGTKIAVARLRSAEPALASGAARAVRVARSEVMQAGRRALADGMQAEPRVVGYRRVVSGRRSCGACLALASGAPRKTSRALDVHPSCRCTAEPIVAGAAERVKRPSGREMFEALSSAEQDALFAGRGGADKAELLRSGAIELADLVKRDALSGSHKAITEAPLRSLKA